MDEIRIRELPQKGSSISLSDLLIIEDEDGTKTIQASEFKSLIQQSLFFDTIEDMKQSTLHEGDIVRTLGYRSINDGGGAYYLITYAPTDVEDGIYIHYLYTSDTLRAHYIMSDADINISQAGAYGDGETDDFTVIQKLLNTGNMVTVPRKTYRISGSLDVLSNTTIDLNGATIICENSAAFTIGLDHDAKNITIKNGKFVGINGIELYSMASEISISDCEFYGSNKVTMSKGILINGASNVQIDNIKVGSFSGNEVRYGIYISNGTGNDGEPHYNYNVQLSNLSIITSMTGIYFSGTYVDRNISVVDFSIEGYNQNRYNADVYGVVIASNSDSISLSNGKIKNTTTAVMVTGIISAVVALTDILVDDSDIMYNFASAGSTVHLYGMHRFTGNNTNTAYVFDRITSDIVMQGSFDADRETHKLAGKFKTSLVGSVIDVVSPVGRKKISIASIEQLNDESVNNIIPGYKNVSISLQFSGEVNEIKFPSLSGQVIALYSDVNDCILTVGPKLKIPNSITLSSYEPVLLRNAGGIWTMVQFGGSSDGSTGGTGGGSSTGNPNFVTLMPLTVYFGNNDIKQTSYNGSYESEIHVTPSNIGAAEKVHNHRINDIIGFPAIRESYPNPNPIKIHLNNGTTLGTDYFEYTGESEVEFNIDISAGSGGGTVDLSAYAKKDNFTGTGSFSLNRKNNTETGTKSVAMGNNAEASNNYSVAIGNNVAASGDSATALGNNTLARGLASFASGSNTQAIGSYSQSTGFDTSALGDASFAMGKGTKANGNIQFVYGMYNIEDDEGTYVNIVGGGTSNENRANIYTLDNDGNGYYAGTVTAATPTDDFHLTTKHYVDVSDKNLNSRITEALTLISVLSSANKGFTSSGYKVTDWDLVDASGLVYGIDALNAPPSADSGSTIVGFGMFSTIKEEVYAEGEEDEKINVINDGYLFAFNVTDGYNAEDDGTMSFPMYIRQLSGGVWDDWYRFYFGHGDIDEYVFVEPEPEPEEPENPTE